ncbi:hypothetical protein SAMN05444422_103202 [Halobiforma haloterrestris]|uniref:Uncharacterized protein n=1 Tax=Natronobacterium haloterrestre TaxID=148448 RepID=A0A1I1F6B2_NATHA|nr:hypothetical protein [Halobiforma haloterrestris]SFB95009.1 hypothetical protein SAMN05444422_103202 [Halobiforma haloterrestris]
MSTRPTGTILDDDRLLALRETDETAASELALELGPVADFMDASAGDDVDWGVDEHGDLPMLVCSAIADAETGDAPYPRRVLEDDDDALVVPVPDPIVRAAPPEGLGLDLEAYDPDRPLLFDPITAGETIGFVPVRFGDGEPYREEPLPEASGESDPVAEGTIDHERDADPTPRPETMDAPIDPVVLDGVLADAPNDVPESDVVGVLEAIRTHDLVGAGNHVAGADPVTVDDRAICLLEDDAWVERLAPELEAADVDVDPDALAAAREAHERQADRLLEAADGGYDDLEGEYDVVVTNERDTAEWEVTET